MPVPKSQLVRGRAEMQTQLWLALQPILPWTECESEELSAFRNLENT